MDKCIAIITARGGSKRIPRKNIKIFHGHPIIKYSIDAASTSGCFNEIMVSTDDTEIGDLSKLFGAKVPFYRSKQASNDFSTTTDVLIEVLTDYMSLNRSFEFCCCIYPTAPFVTANKLQQAYSILKEGRNNCVVPVVRFPASVFRSFKIEDFKLKMNWPQFINTRSQDLPSTYYDSGQFYFFRVESLFQNKTLFTDFTVPLVVPEAEVQDIDNEEDWKLAELKYEYYIKNNFNK